MTSAAAAMAPVPAPFIVESILPSNQVHLIFGPARAGKTTLALQIMDDWSHARPVLGRASFPSPHCWISCERNTDSIRSHMSRIGISPDSCPHFSLLDQELRENQTIEAAIAIARKRIPRLAVAFLDGFHALCPGKPFDAKDVQAFMVHVHQLLRDFKLTIVATVASPKSRPEDSATPPGERFMGSGSWASTTDCKILVDLAERGDPKNPARRVFLMPSNVRASVSDWEFNESGLLIYRGETEEKKSKTAALDQWLDMAIDYDTTFETEQVIALAEELDISRRSAERWLAKQLEKGIVYRVCEGQYRKTKPTPN